MSQLLLPIATDAVGQTLYKTMMEGKGLKIQKLCLVWRSRRSGLLRNLPMALLPWVYRSIKGTNNFVNRLK